MKIRYFKRSRAPVPSPLLGRTDAELGMETFVRDHPDDGNPLALTAKDEKCERRADFEHMRSRVRGEQD